jgi:hypothetical protein
MVAAVMAAGSFAQTIEDLQKQLNEFKAQTQTRIKNLEAENAALKADKTAPQDVGLENEINRLSERMAAGTNVRSAASQVKLGGEFRFRGYYSSGDFADFINTPGTPGTEGKNFDSEHDGYWGDMRARLNFQYDFGCDATAFAELQAHNGFGQDDDGLPEEFDGTDREGDVHLYQAWLEFRNIFCRSELSARIGRQEVVLGNQFQFGNADWYNGIVHDGLRVDWRSQCWSLTLLAVKLTTNDGDFNQLSAFAGDHDDDELYSAYFTLKSIKNHTIDLYWIYINGHGGFAHNSGASIIVDDGFLYPTTHAYYHTFGARIGGWWNLFCGLDWNLEGAIQTGDAHDDFAGDFDVDGAAVEGEIGLTFDKASRFRVFARALWAEGSDDDSTGYLINFPNRHSNTANFRARYGLADLIPMTNVFTAQVGLTFDPACNWTLGATALWAESEQDSIITGDPIDYGWELDVWAEYRYSQQITLGIGLAFVFPDEDTFAGLDDNTQFIGYAQARLWF